MRVSNDLLVNAQKVQISLNSAALDVTYMLLGELTAVITDSTPAVKTWVSGLAEIDTFNFPALAGAGDGDYCVQYDYTGAAWAVALDTTGGAANTPTGAVWASIPAANKVYLDVHTTTTAAQMATAVKAGFNALTGFTTVVSASDAAADGHLADTNLWAGVVTAPSAHNKNDSGAGSITVVRTTTGTVSPVAATGNTVTVAAHGYLTGLKVRLTTTGGLPTGLSTGIDYWLIAVDANTLQFASSLANAQAATVISLTGYGTGTETITPQSLAGTIKLQKATDPYVNPGVTPQVAATWQDIASSSQNYSTSTPLNWTFGAGATFPEVGFPQLRAVITTTSGYATVTLRSNFKGA